MWHDLPTILIIILLYLSFRSAKKEKEEDGENDGRGNDRVSYRWLRGVWARVYMCVWRDSPSILIITLYLSFQSAEKEEEEKKRRRGTMTITMSDYDRYKWQC